MKLFTKFFLLLIMLTVGCGRIPETHYYTIYYQIPETSSSAARSNYVLSVAKITADAMYQGDRIVYQETSYQVKFYNYRRWIEAPPDLLQQWLVRHLRATHIFADVVTYSNRFKTSKDFELSVHLRNFKEVDSESQWHALVGMDFLLFQDTTMVWHEEITKMVAAKERTPMAIVEAISEAVKMCFDAAAEKIYQAVNKTGQTG